MVAAIDAMHGRGPSSEIHTSPVTTKEDQDNAALAFSSKRHFTCCTLLTYYVSGCVIWVAKHLNAKFKCIYVTMCP